MGRLQDRLVLITGASRGQGAEEVKQCVAEGAIVFLTDVDDVAGTALADTLGPNVHYMHLDVAQEEDWAATMHAIGQKGALYGLVNNAAIYQPNSLLETATESFDRHVQINLRGSFLGMRYAAQAMSAKNRGSIVNICSTSGLRGSPGSFAYSATKWGLRGMTLSAAAGLAAQGIRVNAVCPGPIDTDMIRGWTADRRAERLAQIPMGRMGTVSEVSKLVLFLLSDDSSYMTGAEIVVDGGAIL